MSSQQRKKIHLKTWKIPSPTESTENNRHKNSFCVTWNCLLYLNPQVQWCRGEEDKSQRFLEVMIQSSPLFKKNQKDQGGEGKEGEETLDFWWLIGKYIFRLASLWQWIMLRSHTVAGSFFRKSELLEFTLQLLFKLTAVEGYIFKAICGRYIKGKAGHDSSFHNGWCCSSFYSILINSARNYFAICLL